MAVSQQTFARKKPDQLVYLELGSANGGMLLSISEDGFRFRAVSPLRANGAVPFAFSLDGTRRLEGMGEIEWLEDDGKSGGMRFSELPDDSRAALNQWLCSEVRERTSGREVTPTAAAPRDTIQKIREELRRGYPRKKPSDEPAPSQKGSKYEKLVLPERPVLDEEEQGPPPPTAVPILERLMGPRQPAPRPPESPQAPVNQADSTEQPSTAAPVSESPRLTSRIPWRPPFSKTLPESPAKPASSAQASSSVPSSSALDSAFVKKAREAPHPAAAPPNVVPPTPQASLPSLRSFAVTETGDLASRSSAGSSAASPAHPTAASAAHSRPYIPPPDDSYEAAWSRAKLTPPDSPHLSRAAAGSIIGLALVIILGALVVNFRQDIGALVIDLGHQISGNTPDAPPSAAAMGSSSQPAAAQPSGATPAPDSGASAPKETPSPQKNQDSAAQNQSALRPAESAPSGSSGKAADSKPAVEAAASKPAASGASAKSKSKEPVPSKLRAADIPKKLVPESELQQSGESAGEGGSGEQEFNLARDILRGPSRQRELPAAVALLWSGVRKGYVPAEVTLADLYRRGEGVEKNCDQAQVLLVAASRKGSPEARSMLEFMVEHGGCQ